MTSAAAAVDRLRLPMVIQLTKSELAILKQAAQGRRVPLTARQSADMKLLLEMQLVVEAENGVEITLMGQRVLEQVARGRPRSD